MGIALVGASTRGQDFILQLSDPLDAQNVYNDSLFSEEFDDG